MTEESNRVLIVDDEVFFLEAIDEILSAAGFDTVQAEDGEGALVAVTDPTIGVVVLDVRLPDMDGIQVLAEIREMRPELSIIMLSASTDQEIVLEALRLGPAITWRNRCTMKSSRWLWGAPSTASRPTPSDSDCTHASIGS